VRWSYLAIVVLAALAVQSFAATVAVTNTHLQTKYGTLANVYFETSSGPGSSTPGTNTALIPPGTSGSYSIPQATSGYLWSPQFTGATTVSAGNWVFDFWAASAAYSYVPVTLTNCATCAATPDPLQLMIQPVPSSYSTYEASDLGNIGFCMDTLCSTRLYSWLEGCGTSAPYGACSTASTLATFWVELTSSIAASGGSLTIYMVFLPTSTEFDGVYRGEAPQLSATYAAYDNGANVFNAYFNGNTPTSSFSVYTGDTLTQTKGIPGPGGTTINAIEAKGATGAHVPAFSFNEATSNAPLTAESSFSLNAADKADATGVVGFVDNAAVASIKNGITAQMGYDSSYFSQAYDLGGAVTLAANGYSGTVTTNWVYGSVTYTGSTATSWSAYIAPQLYSSTNGFSGTVANNPLSSAGSIYLGQISGSSAIDVYYNWVRARVYLPNSALPTVSIGNGVSSNTVGVSIYVTGPTGTVVTTVASNVQSPVLGTAEGLFSMAFAEAQVSIPASDYLSVVITASSDTCTVYWGTGQLTDFQVPVKVLT